jgi:hypothetical protein
MILDLGVEAGMIFHRYDVVRQGHGVLKVEGSMELLCFLLAAAMTLCVLSSGGIALILKNGGNGSTRGLERYEKTRP